MISHRFFAFFSPTSTSSRTQLWTVPRHAEIACRGAYAEDLQCRVHNYAVISRQSVRRQPYGRPKMRTVSHIWADQQMGQAGYGGLCIPSRLPYQRRGAGPFAGLSAGLASS